MTTVDQYSDANVAGLIETVELVSIVNVSDVSKPDGNRKVTVTLKAGKTWDSFKCTAMKGTYDSQEKIEAAGSSFDNKVTFPVAKIRADASVALNAMQNNRYLCRITLMNGDMILLGSMESPMTKTHSAKVEGDPGGFNGYNVTMEGKSITEPYFCN
jgi:hypothetical protein